MKQCNSLCTKEKKGVCQLCNTLEERDLFLKRCGIFYIDIAISSFIKNEGSPQQATGYQSPKGTKPQNKSNWRCWLCSFV